MHFWKFDSVKRSNLGKDGFSIFLVKSHLAESLSCGTACVIQSDFNLFLCCKKFVPFGCFFRRQSDNQDAVTLPFNFACGVHVMVLISAQAGAFLIEAHERLVAEGFGFLKKGFGQRHA